MIRPSREYYQTVSNIPWEQILKKLGYTSKKKDNGRHLLNCLFHKELSASLVLYEPTLSYHCYGCGINGDKFDFVARFLGGNSKRARAFLKKHFKIDSLHFEKRHYNNE